MKAWKDIDPPKGVYRKILDGQNPALVWKENCPVELGDEIVLTTVKGIDAESGWSGAVPRVSLRITKISRKDKNYIADYVVNDGRDVYLAFGGGETSSPSRAIDQIPYDPALARQYATEARAKAAKLDEDRDKAYRSFRERLKTIREGLTPLQDVYLLAALRRALHQAEEGELE